MPGKEPADRPTLDELFPESGRVLLTGGGKEFIERIGVEAARSVVLNVMVGENIRDQTEPLTQQRVAQISGGIVALFARGATNIEDFTNQLSEMAIRQIKDSKGKNKTSIWLVRWLIGMTEKSWQNVLRSSPERLETYVVDLESALEQAAAKCRADIGDLRMTLGFVEDGTGSRVELDWKDITRLTTTIGSQTLTIRGSEKSMYGKLFERLILGSFLTILGFQRVNPLTNRRTERVFWLSDSSSARESDATLLLRPGKVGSLRYWFHRSWQFRNLERQAISI